MNPPGTFRRFDDLILLETTPDQLLDAIASKIRSRETCTLLYLNPHIYTLACRDARLRAALRGAHWVLVDGIGIVIASRVFRSSIARRLTLMDYIGPLLEQAADHQWKVFFIGGSRQVSEQLKPALLRRLPELQIVGSRHGFYDHAEQESLLREIKEAAPDLVFVGMGTPQQELWIEACAKELNGTALIAAGAALAHLAGVVRRAPAWMHRNGLEWLFRLVCDPRRLAVRYLIGGPIFLYYCLRRRGQPYLG
jgi:exopolysaccharide biosynthesis WecB/TagA/CpsF family protein